ncbi:hypothetical protein LWI29_001503 [Acer saccharum]|uniref:Uncharacterized protein n=1 Tax=Acer saccharum TaxID=4024 RepID=A0AA39TAF2_ACESA|nr:hypothetical protein LWI29_001503 [Acer saccharum]
MIAKVGELRVSISKKEVVAAVLPLPEHWLPLSNLDLLLPPLDVGVLFCYRNTTSHGFGAMVGALKKAMAQALVSYYALAGEVVPNSVGEPEILCNNRGVDFIEAHADVELKHLNLYNPDDTIEGKLVPNKKKGVLAVQLPCFRRSLLNPRRPGCIDPTLDDMYVPISTLPPPKQPLEDDDDHLISRIYYVTIDQLNHLQSLATSNGHKRTKLEAFSAFLWKMVAQCDTKNEHKITKMGIVVDGRKQVHDFLENAVTKDHFLGLIDWVEAHRPEPALAKIYSSGSSSEDGPAFVVSSGQQFPISKVDFGWGKPFFGSYHFPWGDDAGYVMPMPTPTGNSDWIVYMHLMKKQLEFIETQAYNLFNPLILIILINSITSKLS